MPATAAVAGHLDLDVAGPREEPLDEHRPVAERGLRLGLRDVEDALERGRVFDDAHALAAATARGLEDDRVAGHLGRRMRLVQRGRPPRGCLPAAASPARAAALAESLSPNIWR
jgi:hypothetical protein